MIGSAMHRMIARKPQRGERIDGLTREAIDLWFATERDRRRLDWIAVQLGAAADQAWRGLALAVARAEMFTAESRLCWQPMPPDERLGEPVIVVPRWAADDEHWGGMAVIDLVAIDPRDPQRVASRTGACEALGELAASVAVDDGRPVIWHASAMSWLRAGGDVIRPGADAGPARFYPLHEAADVVERLLLQATEIHAETEELGHELTDRARALRKRLLPPMPDFLVADEAREAA